MNPYDGGVTWTRSGKTPEILLVEIHFTNANNGWACSGDNGLYHLKP